jgi:hypothetical protein
MQAHDLASSLPRSSKTSFHQTERHIDRYDRDTRHLGDQRF